MTTFSEEFEKDFQRMAFVLENVDSACWIYAVYSHIGDREAINKRLQSEIALPFFVWDYSDDKPYPIDYLRDLTEEQKQQQAIVLFFNTTDGGDKTIKSLDFNREKFAQYPHSLVFWVTKNELGEMARKAGHFWAQRRGTFNFSNLSYLITITISYSVEVEWLNKLLNIDDNQEALRQLYFYQQLLIEYENVEQPQTNTQRFIAETNDKISYLLYYLGRYSDAIDFCKKALNIYQTLLGANSYSVIATTNNIAVLYISCSKQDEAELLLNRILAILKQNNDQLSLAKVLNNFALLYFSPNEEDNKAESILRQSLEIKEKILGKEDLSVAISLDNLAELYQKQRKYTEAESLLQRSLMIREKLLHKDYSGIANILFSLAKIYQQQGKYRDALSFFEKSLVIRESISGKDHPKTKEVKAEYERFLEKKSPEINQTSHKT